MLMEIKINKNVIKGCGASAFDMTRLFVDAPSAGQIGKLSTPDSSVTLDCNFADYDILLFQFGMRVWGWGMKYEIIPVQGLGHSEMSIDNVFGVTMPDWANLDTMSMIYYITNNNTITIKSNTHYSGDNHLYIKAIYGMKFKL